jgi:hypothetical protein
MDDRAGTARRLRDAIVSHVSLARLDTELDLLGHPREALTTDTDMVTIAGRVVQAAIRGRWYNELLHCLADLGYPALREACADALAALDRAAVRDHFLRVSQDIGRPIAADAMDVLVAWVLRDAPDPATVQVRLQQAAEAVFQ